MKATHLLITIGDLEKKLKFYNSMVEKSFQNIGNNEIVRTRYQSKVDLINKLLDENKKLCLSGEALKWVKSIK